jgi:hypothetical protein
MNSLTEKKNEVEKKRRNEPPQKHFECLLKFVLFVECKEQVKHIGKDIIRKTYFFGFVLK